jgi:hypothetical protein
MTTLELAATAAVVGVVGGASLAIGKATGEFAVECADRAFQGPKQAMLRGASKVGAMCACENLLELTEAEKQYVEAYMRQKNPLFALQEMAAAQMATC